MPRVCWQLQNERPNIQINLMTPNRATSVSRTLLADTGAGSRYGGFELILTVPDCRRFQIQRGPNVYLRGAYSGNFFTYMVRIEIPALGFAGRVTAVPVPAMQLPIGFDGLAAFSFLNRFTYGNFGHNDQFCLETP
jgi:hypothetical protein